MKKILILLLAICSINILCLASSPHTNHPTPTPPPTVTIEEDTNLLQSIKISLDKTTNRIHFVSPITVEGVNISIKDRGNRIILEQKNMKISKTYSISFPALKHKNNQYTVILQKGSHILVERLPKEFL